jgi:hypothetical protein
MKRVAVFAVALMTLASVTAPPASLAQGRAAQSVTRVRVFEGAG